MSVLALDTCLGAVSVALLRRATDGSAHVFDAYEERETGHAERVVVMLADVMRDARATFADIDTIAVTVGPGSFTGVRTGIAMARALALSTARPVVGTTSLAVIAAGVFAGLAEAQKPSRILVAIDARRGEFYGQSFDGSAVAPTGPAILASAEALAQSLPDTPSLVVGSGAPAVMAAARSRGKPASSGVVSLQPSARALAAIAYNLPRLDPIMPLYLRAPDAKPQSASIVPRA